MSGQTSWLRWRPSRVSPTGVRMGTIYRGWVKVKNGDVAEGISLLRSGSAAYRATGAEVWMPHHIALLARACEIAGQIEEALTLLDDALQIVERTGERWFAAELNRHKGQLLLRQGHSEAAEELYRKALSIARGAGGQALGIARRREPRPAPPRPGPPRRSPRPPRAGLRLVHRRLRHPRSQRGKGAARRAGVSRSASMTKSDANDRFLGDPTIRWRGHEGLKWVDSGIWHRRSAVGGTQSLAHHGHRSSDDRSPIRHGVIGDEIGAPWSRCI